MAPEVVLGERYNECAVSMWTALAALTSNSADKEKAPMVWCWILCGAASPWTTMPR